MGDHEVPEQVLDAIEVDDPEEAAQVDAVVDQDEDRRQPRHDPEGEGKNGDLDVVGHDQARLEGPVAERDLGPGLVHANFRDDLRRRHRVLEVGQRQDEQESEQRRPEEQRRRGCQVGP